MSKRMTDGEIVDFLESEVVSMKAHPMGWQFVLDDGGGDAGARVESVLVEGDDFREAVEELAARQQAAVSHG